jgi:hypothetical protein
MRIQLLALSALVAASVALPAHAANLLPLNQALSDDDLETYSSVRRALVEGFDNICGDTFCEGDFTDLQSVAFSCLGTQRSVSECAWIFGGSTRSVDGATGRIDVDARTFTCPIAVKTSTRRFLGVLGAAGDRALFEPLPGTDASIYDALADCFEAAQGAPVDFTEGSFVGLEDALDDATWTPWLTARAALSKAFDDICGDTFCEGDFANIEPLSLTCAIDASTQHVTSCAWPFARGELDVSAGGFDPRADTVVCPFTVDASLDALLVALAEDPLYAPLPGQQKSIYDALGDCL